VYLSPDDVADNGPARILVGVYGKGKSPLNPGVSLNYLAVRLRRGDTWRYQPGRDHTVGWASVSRGLVSVPDPIDAGELVIFESSTTEIHFIAKADAEFVVGSAIPQTHDLALGNYSVHTSPAALRSGEQRLREIQQRLRNEGRL
jgi:redox-sensitive bicupin YhaK (pirin superfamily)